VIVGLSRGRRGQLQPQVVPGKVIEVVEGMLGESEEVLGLLVLQRIGLDRDAQREDGTARLESLQ